MSLRTSTANPVTIANAHLLVGQAVDGEVLAELSISEIVSTELASPTTIGIDLIDEDGPVLAAVRNQVPLPVAVDIKSPHRASALNRYFPNGGADGFSEFRWEGIVICGHPIIAVGARSADSAAIHRAVRVSVAPDHNDKGG